MITTMKRILPAILWCSMAASSFAEVVFDWTLYDAAKRRVGTTRTPYGEKINNALENRTTTELENTVKAAALLFTDERYATHGPYNFVTAPETYTVSFIPLGKIGGEYNFSKRYMELDIRLIADPIQLELHAFCLWACAYNDWKLPPGKQTEGILAKEKKFVEERKEKIPKHIFDQLMNCYKNDTEAAYLLRNKVIEDWCER